MFKRFIDLIDVTDRDLPDDWDFPDLWRKNVPDQNRMAIPLGVSPKGVIEGQRLFASLETLDDVIAGTKRL